MLSRADRPASRLDGISEQKAYRKREGTAEFVVTCRVSKSASPRRVT